MGKRIFISGRLSGTAVEYNQNMHKMIQAAVRLRKQGYAVFVPALDVLMGVMGGDFDYATYFDNSFSWVEVSDGMLMLEGWEGGKGTWVEMDKARKCGVPVFFSEEELHCVYPPIKQTEVWWNTETMEEIKG